MVRQIKERYVPVVVGMYDQAEAYTPNPGDDFFNKLSATSGNPGKPFYMPNGTPFFCTADGIYLRNGLFDWKKYRSSHGPGAIKVPEYQVDPERVKKNLRLTRPPANGLILRTYIRALKTDAEGKLYAPKVIDWGHGLKLPSEPNRDFMWLQESEWKALVPVDDARGQKTPVVEVVRDRICFWHIAGGYWSLPGRYSAADFQSQEMTLVIEAVTPKQVRLRLQGDAVMKKGSRYRFAGVLEYDRRKERFTRFDVIALCDEGENPKPLDERFPPVRHYGVAFELSGDRTDDLLPPFFLREQVDSPAWYLGNNPARPGG